LLDRSGFSPIGSILCSGSEWNPTPSQPKAPDHGWIETNDGDTTYLKNGGTLEKAAAMAKDASTRTTQLYDRRRDEVSLDEVERITI
jgi:hypothetical protein